jgi:putative hydrolase of the HAD superfamily
VPLKAAFFDVGDTLVEHWAGRDVSNRIARAQLCAALGEPVWLDDLLDAEIEPRYYSSLLQTILAGAEIKARQETERWYRDWFVARGIDLDGLDLERLRTLMCVPLADISSPVAGAFEALRWCAAQGLRVVLVTNTLARSDAEALADWRRFGLDEAIHGIVTSHSAGWRKPHRAIFERALEVAGAKAEEAFHVGDNLIADVWGAQQVGLRAVWRRSERAVPPTDERGEPLARAAREGTEPCRHPSERLFVDGGAVRCSTCGDLAGIDIRPDAVVDDLTQLPAAVAPWLGAPVA